MLPLSSSSTLPSLPHTRLHVLCSQKSRDTVQILDEILQHTRCAERDHGREGRRVFLLATLTPSSQLFPVSASGKTKKKGPYDEKRLLDQNRCIQEANNAPKDFPNFIREGNSILR